MVRAMSFARAQLAVSACLASWALCALGCPEPLPTPPKECTAASDCLPDETCTASQCVLKPKCNDDADCGSPAQACTFPAQLCVVRAGFGEECSAAAPCTPGSFCALGRCRATADARPCARRTDCPVGQGCDRATFFCIEEAACTLADTYPELACDPAETCDAVSQRCLSQCQNQCTPATAATDCGASSKCDAACRCVQCLTADDCGAGLVCNVRAGRCESENLCFSNIDCTAPLVCDPTTALCQAPPPPCNDDGDCLIAEICDRTTGICELPGGACVDDRFEDSDTPAGAHPIAFSASGAPVVLDQLQLCPDADDVYSVALHAGDALTASVSGSSPQARATVWLLDSTGEDSLRFAETPPRGSGTIAYTAQVDETVFVRINALVGTTPYDLTVSGATGTTCVPDVFESGGGNDSAATATAASIVPVGAAFAASLCPGDDDFYRVDLAAGEALAAELSFDPTHADFDLLVVDATAGDVLADSSGVTSPEVARVRTSTARGVVVRVRPFGASTGDYQLHLTRIAPFVCAADASEPDAVLGDAVHLATTQSLPATSRTLCLGDVDSYVVSLLDFERLIVHAAYDATDLDLRLEVLDETATTELARAPVSVGGSTLTYDARGDETVVVRLTAADNTSAPYMVSVARENQVQCTADDSEENDTAATAAPLPAAGTVLNLCGSDQDFFAVEGTAGKSLTVDLSFLQSDGDLDVSILGIDPAQVLATSDGTGDGEHVTALLPLDGIYTVRVFSLTNTAAARYQMDVSLQAP